MWDWNSVVQETELVFIDSSLFCKGLGTYFSFHLLDSSIVSLYFQVEALKFGMVATFGMHMITVALGMVVVGLVGFEKMGDGEIPLVATQS